MKLTKKITVLVLAMLLILTSTFLLSSCKVDPSTCVHSWSSPTCYEPAQCRKCDTYKPDGQLGNHNFVEQDGIIKCNYCNILLAEYEYELSGGTGNINFSEEIYKNKDNCDHQWIDATCTVPQTCDKCGKVEGNANGHTEGSWIITTSPTINYQGTEELQCSVCNEVLDSRTINKKTPNVADDHFNFTDDELISYMNNNSTAYVNSTELDGFDGFQTAYQVISSDGSINAILILNHANNKNDNIQAIMIYSDEDNFANALGVWIGTQIDSNFDSDASINALLLDEYYICGDMTLMRLNLDSETEVCLLAPSEYIADLLS